MVKRLLLLSLMVLVLCGAGATMSVAGGPAAGGPGYTPVPNVPGPPPICGPVQSSYQVVREQTCPVPAQLRRVRVVAPYLAGLCWPRKPLAFVGNPQTFPNPIAPGRYEWLVPAAEIAYQKDRCVYVKANYVRQPPCGPGPVSMPAPPPMPARLGK